MNLHQTLSLSVHSISFFNVSDPVDLAAGLVRVEAHIIPAPARNMITQTILTNVSTETRRLDEEEVVTASSREASLVCFPSSTSTGAYPPSCAAVHHFALNFIAVDRIILEWEGSWKRLESIQQVSEFIYGHPAAILY